MAAILFQRPVMIVTHATEMLDDEVILERQAIVFSDPRPAGTTRPAAPAQDG